FCAFVPHVVALYPVYWDGKDYIKTGQVLKAKNSSASPRNATYQGDADDIGSSNRLLRPSEDFTIGFKRPSSTPFAFSSQLHPWMSAVAWVLDHPFAAVTDRDGKFEIRNVPTGAELTLVAWHEARANFHEMKFRLNKSETRTVNLKVGR